MDGSKDRINCSSPASRNNFNHLPIDLSPIQKSKSLSDISDTEINVPRSTSSVDSLSSQPAYWWDGTSHCTIQSVNNTLVACDKLLQENSHPVDTLESTVTNANNDVLQSQVMNDSQEFDSAAYLPYASLNSPKTDTPTRKSSHFTIVLASGNKSSPGAGTSTSAKEQATGATNPDNPQTTGDSQSQVEGNHIDSEQRVSEPEDTHHKPVKTYSAPKKGGPIKQTHKKKVTLGEGLSNTFSLGEKVDILENKVKLIEHSNTRQASEMFHTNGNRLKLPMLPRFSGLATEDAKSWLARFNAYKRIDNWGDQDACLILATYFEDVAFQWHQALEDSIKNDWELLEAAFLERFVSGAPKWVREQTLASRKQGETESIDSYITDLRRMCAQLGKNDNDLLEKFLLGLKPGLKRYVIGQNPSDIKTAENSARVAESLNVLMPESEKSTSVAAMQEALHPVVDQLQASVAAIQQDVQKLQQGGQFNGSRSFRQNNGQRQNFSPSRNPRSSAVTCQLCGKGGHEAKSCFSWREQKFGRSSSADQKGDKTCFRCGKPGHFKRDCPGNIFDRSYDRSFAGGGPGSNRPGRGRPSLN